MQFNAKAAAVVCHNGIDKILLTVESAPSSQDEHLLLNLLRSRGELKEGTTYCVTIEERLAGT
jgi:hypothetical protein